jgi:hypothetical protein
MEVLDVDTGQISLALLLEFTIRSVIVSKNKNL